MTFAVFNLTQPASPAVYPGLFEPLAKTCTSAWNSYTLCSDDVEASYASYVKMFRPKVESYLKFLKKTYYQMSSKEGASTPKDISRIDALKLTGEREFSPISIDLKKIFRQKVVMPVRGKTPQVAEINEELKKLFDQKVLKKWFPNDKMRATDFGISELATDKGYSRRLDLHSDLYTSSEGKGTFRALATLSENEVPYYEGSIWDTKSNGQVQITKEPLSLTETLSLKWEAIKNYSFEALNTKYLKVRVIGDSYRRVKKIISFDELVKPAYYSRLRTTIIPGLNVDIGSSYSSKDSPSFGSSTPKDYEGFHFDGRFNSKAQKDLEGCSSTIDFLAKSSIQLPLDKTVFFSPLHHVHGIPLHRTLQLTKNCTVLEGQKIDSFPENVKVQRFGLKVYYEKED